MINLCIIYLCSQLRKSVPCHIEGLSCGRPCKKELPCIRHNCIKACHEGDCLTDSANAEERYVCVLETCNYPHDNPSPPLSCGQPCTEIRQSCDHPCSAPCHDPPCPAAAPCKERVKVTCECGHLSATRTCSDQASDFQRLQVRKSLGRRGLEGLGGPFSHFCCSFPDVPPHAAIELIGRKLGRS